MSRTSRRQFAKTLAAAGAAVPLAALAQTPPSAAKATMEVVRAQYGKHLSEEELVRITQDFEESAPALERLRAMKIVNGDEPDWTFAASVRRW